MKFALTNSSTGGAGGWSLSAVSGITVDTTAPMLTVTSPTANQRLGNGAITLRGTAGDAGGPASVLYKFNTNAWLNPSTTNGFTNWSSFDTTSGCMNGRRAELVLRAKPMRDCYFE